MIDPLYLINFALNHLNYQAFQDGLLSGRVESRHGGVDGGPPPPAVYRTARAFDAVF